MNPLHNTRPHSDWQSATTSSDARKLLESLPKPLPEPVLHPVLVAVSGLPGSGKSFFSRRLAERIPLVVLESDALRKVLVPSPLHTAEESTSLFRAIHQLIAMLLKDGVPVLLDATNLAEAHREPLYRIAAQCDARVVMVLAKAPVEVVRQRLETRMHLSQRQDSSEADWEVYQRLRPTQEPIHRSHIVVDTSRDMVPAMEKVLREIHHWMRKATN